MAESLNSSISVDVANHYVGDAALGAQSESFLFGDFQKLTDGTGPGQADQVWHQSISLSSPFGFTIDLTSGSEIPSQTVWNALVDRPFAAIKVIFVHNLGTQPNQTIKFGAGASQFASALFPVASSQTMIGPGDVWFASSRNDGYTVGATTDGVLLTITDIDAPTTAEIVIVGVAA